MTDDPTANGAAETAKARRQRPAPPVIDLTADEVKVEAASAAPDIERESPVQPSARRLDVRLFGAALGGGVLGGVIVAGGLYLWTPPDLAGARMMAIETALEKLATQSTVNSLEQRLSKAEAAAADARRLAVQAPKSGVDLTPIEARLAALEDALAKSTHAPALANGVSGEEALRLTLAALIRDKVERGIPFAREFDVLSTRGGSLTGQDRLKPFAEKGVTTYEDLRVELVQLESTQRQAETSAVGAGSGVSDFMLKGLSHFVTITPSDQAPIAPAGGFSDIEAALLAGDGAKALGLWQTLPQAQREALKDWTGKVEARLSAEQAADDVMHSALDALQAKGATP